MGWQSGPLDCEMEPSLLWITHDITGTVAICLACLISNISLALTSTEYMR